MKWKAWYLDKSAVERAKYAQKAGTTPGYIEIHLMAPPARRKTPRQDLMERLAEASHGEISMADLLRHFYEQSELGAERKPGKAVA